MQILYQLDIGILSKLIFLPFGKYKFKAELTFIDLIHEKDKNFMNKYNDKTNIFDHIKLNIFPKELNILIGSYLYYSYTIYSKHQDGHEQLSFVNL